MLNQSFSVNNLIKLLKKNDPKRFRIGRNVEEYKKYISDKVNNSIETYSFGSIAKSRINNKDVYIFKDLWMCSLLEKLMIT